jgi:hypothetical protein
MAKVKGVQIRRHNLCLVTRKPNYSRTDSKDSLTMGFNEQHSLIITKQASSNLLSRSVELFTDPSWYFPP